MTTIINEKFSDEQSKTINELVDWVLLLKEDPEYSNRLKIWKFLKNEGSDGCLILEAFRLTGLFNG